MPSREHRSIFLEPLEDCDPSVGRIWCETNVWGDEAVEYVLRGYLDALISSLEKISLRAKPHPDNDDADRVRQLRYILAEAEYALKAAGKSGK